MEEHTTGTAPKTRHESDLLADEFKQFFASVGETAACVSATYNSKDPLTEYPV